MIQSGRADVVVAGGAEACITPITIAGFAQARTVSTRNDDPEGASRPFDSDRDGFVLGEGAGAVVLERADRAAARGARVYARLGGYGITSDAYHITGNHPEGIGQIAAMQNAIRMADLSASDVGHVNAHATSTVVGDVGEAAAIRKAIGDHPVVTAPKSALGHLVGGAGAVEAIVAILSIYHGSCPRRSTWRTWIRRWSWTSCPARHARSTSRRPSATRSASADTTPRCCSLGHEPGVDTVRAVSAAFRRDRDGPSLAPEFLRIVL